MCVEPRLRSAAFFVQYDFNRLTQDFDELLDSHSLRAGVQKQFVINRRSSLFAVLMGDWDLDATVDALKRNEYTAELTGASC